MFLSTVLCHHWQWTKRAESNAGPQNHRGGERPLQYQLGRNLLSLIR